MAEQTNADRAKLAKRACEAFASRTGQDFGEEFRDVVVALMANLMHLWHDDGGDAYRLVDEASDRFQREYEAEEYGEE